MARSHQAATRQASLSVWGNATPVPATVPEWAEDSLGDYFFTAKFSTRLGRGIEFGGALDTGRTVIDSCFVADNPQNLEVLLWVPVKDDPALYKELLSAK